VLAEHAFAILSTLGVTALLLSAQEPALDLAPV
jgi:hypothetical protein